MQAQTNSSHNPSKKRHNYLKNIVPQTIKYSTRGNPKRYHVGIVVVSQKEEKTMKQLCLSLH
jgi:hypothetical protein